MLAGKMKLKTFLGLGGAGVVAAVGGLGWWLSSRPEPPPPPEPPPVSTVVETPEEPVTLAQAEPSTPPTTSAIETLSADGAPHHADVLSWVGKDLGTDKKKDVTKGKAHKVNVYQDEGHATANRAKVDLDRDDKWDEKWTFKDDGQVSRQVAPADDENYTETWVWNGQDWARE